MTKLLIAIKSCWRDKNLDYHDVIRETWGKDLSPEVKLQFFVGGSGDKSNNLQKDEVSLNCGDSYAELPQKTKKIMAWSLALDWRHQSPAYDYTFLCDTGSFVIPHHLMNCGFENYDYMGFWGGGSHKSFPYRLEDAERGCPVQLVQKCWPWAAGGGYFLSRKAMEIVANTKLKYWAEDLQTGQTMAENGIHFEDRPRRFKGYVVDWVGGDHNCSANCRRQWMTERYEEAKRICEMAGCDSPIWDKYEDRGRFDSLERVKISNPTPWDKSTRHL